MDDVFIAIIAAIPTMTTVVVGVLQNRASRRRSARSAITGLMVEDHVRVAEGKAPENEQAIHDEFDIYRKSGGNSYVQGKVKAYDEWHDQLLVVNKKGGNNAQS